MKLSTKGRYGVRLMLDLAQFSYKGPVLLRDISRRQEISEKYLGHLIPPLKNAGLIKSIRGAKGGYILGKRASDIRLSDIVSLLEGPICIVDCVNDPSLCNRSEHCSSRDVWKEISENTLRILSGITLEHMVDRQKNKHEEQIYYI